MISHRYHMWYGAQNKSKYYINIKVQPLIIALLLAPYHYIYLCQQLPSISFIVSAPTLDSDSQTHFGCSCSWTWHSCWEADGTDVSSKCKWLKKGNDRLRKLLYWQVVRDCTLISYIKWEGVKEKISLGYLFIMWGYFKKNGYR